MSNKLSPAQALLQSAQQSTFEYGASKEDVADVALKSDRTFVENAEKPFRTLSNIGMYGLGKVIESVNPESEYADSLKRTAAASQTLEQELYNPGPVMTAGEVAVLGPIGRVGATLAKPITSPITKTVMGPVTRGITGVLTGGKYPVSFMPAAKKGVDELLASSTSSLLTSMSDPEVTSITEDESGNVSMKIDPGALVLEKLLDTGVTVAANRLMRGSDTNIPYDPNVPPQNGPSGPTSNQPRQRTAKEILQSPQEVSESKFLRTNDGPVYIDDPDMKAGAGELIMKDILQNNGSNLGLILEKSFGLEKGTVGDINTKVVPADDLKGSDGAVLDGSTLLLSDSILKNIDTALKSKDEDKINKAYKDLFDVIEHETSHILDPSTKDLNPSNKEAAISKVKTNIDTIISKSKTAESESELNDIVKIEEDLFAYANALDGGTDGTVTNGLINALNKYHESDMTKTDADILNKDVNKLMNYANQKNTERGYTPAQNRLYELAMKKDELEPVDSESGSTQSIAIDNNMIINTKDIHKKAIDDSKNYIKNNFRDITKNIQSIIKDVTGKDIANNDAAKNELLTRSKDFFDNELPNLLETEPEKFLNVSVSKSGNRTRLNYDSIKPEAIQKAFEEHIYGSYKNQAKMKSEAIEDTMSAKEQQKKPPAPYNKPSRNIGVPKKRDKSGQDTKPKAKAKSKSKASEPNKEADTILNMIENETGVTELKYADTINNDFKDVGSKQNNISISEKLKFTKDPDIIGVENHGKVNAAAKSKLKQGLAVIHEITHAIFPNLSEKAVRSIAEEAYKYMLNKSKALRDRVQISTDNFKKIEEPDIKMSRSTKTILQYINGNKDARDILYGNEHIFTKYNDLENKASKLIDDVLNNLTKVPGIDIDKSSIKILGKELPLSIKKLLMDMNVFDPKKDSIKSILKYKNEANAILNKITASIKDSIDNIDFGRNDIDIKNALIEIDFGRTLKLDDLVNYYKEGPKKIYNRLLKKIGKKKLDRFLENNNQSFKQSSGYLSTLSDYAKLFGPENVKDAIALRAMYILKERNIDILNLDTSKLQVFESVMSEINDIIKKSNINDKSYVVGYYPHITDSNYNLIVSTSPRHSAELLNDGYSEVGNGLFSKIDNEPILESSVFFVDSNKKSGFIHEFNNIEDAKSAAKYIKGNDINVRIQKQGNKYLVISQPTKNIDILNISENPSERIGNTFNKAFGSYFNQKILSPEANKLLGEVIFDKAAKDRTPLSLEENAFMNKIMGTEDIQYHVDSLYKDYMFSKEWLPSNETLSAAFRAWKSIISRMKGNLTFKSPAAFNNAIIGGIINLIDSGVNPKYIPKLFMDTMRDFNEYKKIMKKYNSIFKKDGLKEAQQFLKDISHRNVFVEVLLDNKIGGLSGNPSILFGKDNTFLDKQIYKKLKDFDAKLGTNIADKIFNAIKAVSLDRKSIVGNYLYEAYSNTDLFIRTMGYRYLKQKYGKEKAFDMINDIFVDFGKPVSEQTKTAEYVAFPFLGWFLRMQGGILNTAKRRPITMATVIAAYIGAQYAFDTEDTEDYIGDVRAESWFIDSVFADPAILEMSIPASILNGDFDKLLEKYGMPKGYEEMIAVSKGDRSPAELMGFNFRHY